MLERLHSDGPVQKVVGGGVVHRAELAVAPTPPSAELRDKAIAPAASVQRTATEPNPLSAPAHAVGRIRDEFDKIAKNESDRKLLDSIIGKLLPGYKALMDKIEAPAKVHEAKQAVVELEALQVKWSGSGDSAEGPRGADVSPSDGADNAIAKFEAALRSIDGLRGKLEEDHAGAHDRLLNIGPAASGPGSVARSLGDSGETPRSTVAARDLIMANARAVGVAHGRVSPDMARLVLS